MGFASAAIRLSFLTIRGLAAAPVYGDTGNVRPSFPWGGLSRCLGAFEVPNDLVIMPLNRAVFGFGEKRWGMDLRSIPQFAVRFRTTKNCPFRLNEGLPDGSDGNTGGGRRRGRSRLRGVRFGSGKALAEQRNLAGVMSFVLANVEPLAIIVGRAPGPVLVDGQQPGIVPFGEFCERLFPHFVKDVDVVIAVVSLDRLAAGIAEIH